MSRDVIVVGAGIFGLSAAIELREQGRRVAVLDPGPIPHPLAASTDISKVVRLEYGADEEYMALMEQARLGWRRWNELLGEELYHEVGVCMLTRSEMVPGGFEYESLVNLERRGHRPERLDAHEIGRRFPAWKPDVFVDGFFHDKGGYAESGRVVENLSRRAESLGVELRPGWSVAELTTQNRRITGIRSQHGETLAADDVIVAAGAWTPLLVPEMQSVMKVSGHPVFHLRPDEPDRFAAPEFTVFTADISATGWYGFPLHPRERVVKVANHGIGQELHPTDDERLVGSRDTSDMRSFVRDTFPGLCDARLVFTRRCLYCDTLDEHFWIDRHPELGGLVVAAGGSGHGFKFAPVLGKLVADALEGRPRAKFRWRQLSRDNAGEEEARRHV